MNNAAKKALEKEWTAQQNQLLKERTATEEAVKSELVAALKERLKELKREEAESRKGLPLAERIAATLAISGPALCEIMLDETQPFAPKLAARALPDGRVVSPPLEDLAPFLPRDELRENMLIPLIEEE